MVFKTGDQNLPHFRKINGILLATICLLNFQICAGSNILFFNGLSSHSHLVAFEPLANKLADRGHQVTILSPMISENKHPNVTHFCPQAYRVKQDTLLDSIGELTVMARLHSKYNDYIIQNTEGWDGSVDMCKLLYSSPDFQDWLNSASFDLFIIDAFQRECSLPIAEYFGAKTILFMPSTIFYGDHETWGFPLDASFIPRWATPPWLLPESIVFELTSLKWYFWRQWTFLPKFDSLIQKQMPLTKREESMPSLAELERRASLYFLNQYFTAEFSRSLPPFVVPVGGMHCKESKGIQDKAIKEFIEDPNFDGFIYISFGSMLKVSALPVKNQKIFFETLASFTKIKFLWKWEDAIPENLVPNNILMMKWFPQQDVLAHPKCKGFIGQGGMMSYQQAIFHSIPVIIMPGGGDQILNGRMAQQLGFGIHLELSETTHSTFKVAIEQILHNKRYKEKAIELSKLFKDRPMTAVDTAVYWTEYVLRHDRSSLDHLKSPGMFQTWWQRRVLQWWTTIVLLIVLSIYVIVKSSFSFARVTTKVNLTNKKKRK